jgi:hypothetical protein
MCRAEALDDPQPLLGAPLQALLAVVDGDPDEEDGESRLNADQRDEPSVHAGLLC